MSGSTQNIRVIPDTLDGLVHSVRRGEYRIPQFQREYVWEKTKVVSLFDSIFNEYPIGSFFIWKAAREHNRLFRHSADLGIPPIEEDDNVSFILDGQQRITSLYVTLMGLTVRGTDYSRICFDVKDGRFTHRQPDNKRYLSVHNIWKQNLLKLSKEVPEEHHDTLSNCHQVLKTYPISLVEVREKDLSAVCVIFQRINQAGKRLDRFDLISAMTFSPNFDLREKFREDIVMKLEAKSFGKISSNIVTQLMALLKRGGCTESIQFSLTADEIHEMWPNVVPSILLAADILREAMGVKKCGFLPYNGQLTLLAFFFAKSGQRSLTEKQLEWVMRWFWRSSFGKHYGAGGDSRIGRDSALFDELITGKYPEFEPPLALTYGELIRTKMTWTGSAVRNAFLCLLADRRPLHLVNNSPLDLVNGGISDFTSPEKHHIFPKAHLRNQGDDVEVHALPNFCFLTAELNKRILATQPSIYFPELQSANPDFAKAALCQLVPVGADCGIAEDDYLTFLKTRSELLIEEIERLTGISTAPPADQRQSTVEGLETRLRNFIHTTLLDGHGPKYWKQTISQGIREGAQGRIDHEIRKQPGLSIEGFADHRSKLDFCNVTDYSQIVSNGKNWHLFESTFRRRAEFERHMEAFAEYRNAVMHNRQMTEIVRKAGDLAVVWLETVMATENGANGNEEENSEEEESHDEGSGMVDVTQIIPLKEASDYEEKRKASGPGNSVYERYWTALLNRAAGRTDLLSGLTPSGAKSIYVLTHVTGIRYAIRLLEGDVRALFLVDLKTDGDRRRSMVDALYERREELEVDFGGSLDWLAMASKTERRIRTCIPGGWALAESEWPDIQDQAIDALIRLEVLLRESIQSLKH